MLAVLSSECVQGTVRNGTDAFLGFVKLSAFFPHKMIRTDVESVSLCSLNKSTWVYWVATTEEALLVGAKNLLRTNVHPPLSAYHFFCLREPESTAGTSSLLSQTESGFQLCHLLFKKTWTVDLLPLCLKFLICRMEVVCIVRIKWINTCWVHRAMPGAD